MLPASRRGETFQQPWSGAYGLPQFGLENAHIQDFSGNPRLDAVRTRLAQRKMAASSSQALRSIQSLHSACSNPIGANIALPKAPNRQEFQAQDLRGFAANCATCPSVARAAESCPRLSQRAAIAPY